MTMLPRLQAEETLSAISSGLLSSGYADKKDLTRAVGRLEKVAGGGRRKALKPTPQTLASMGIQTVTVPPSSKSGEAGDDR
jgi:hypothetical protein